MAVHVVLSSSNGREFTGGLAEFERELIRGRRGEGRARAKERGKSLGRPFKLTAHQRQEALARREGGELLSEIALRRKLVARLQDTERQLLANPFADFLEGTPRVNRSKRRR